MLMRYLLAAARAIDRVNEGCGRIAAWLVLIACLISAGNAISRYALDLSSNAWLELQWYMFTAMVLIGAPFVLKVNEHVRVDIFYGRAQPRRRAWIDLLGLIFFLLPVVVAIMVMSWPFFVESYAHGEMSSNAGGLMRWPVKLVVPVGFGLLALQGIAEIIKRIAYLRGLIAMDAQYEKPLQ
jgi:TRAP-type mannitol/chloroaromatic compound transport system permease small subunit